MRYVLILSKFKNVSQLYIFLIVPSFHLFMLCKLSYSSGASIDSLLKSSLLVLPMYSLILNATISLQHCSVAYFTHTKPIGFCQYSYPKYSLMECSYETITDTHDTVQLYSVDIYHVIISQ